MTTKKREKQPAICQQCAACCTYFCIEIDEPDTRSEVDDLAWILAHQGAEIHVGNDEAWNLYVRNRCSYLGEDNRCTIYERRSRICRKHMPGRCDHGMASPKEYDDIEHVFQTDLELWDYWKDMERAKRRLQRERRKRAAKRMAKKTAKPKTKRKTAKRS